jgi:hypothetical protein
MVAIIREADRDQVSVVAKRDEGRIGHDARSLDTGSRGCCEYSAQLGSLCRILAVGLSGHQPPSGMWPENAAYQGQAPRQSLKPTKIENDMTTQN